MVKNHDPADIHAPLGCYTHAIEVPGNMRLLTVSGEIGIRPDGSLAEGIEGQLRQTWANIAAILSAAGMADGLGSIGVVVVGGLALGVSESVGVMVVGSEHTVLISFVILLAVRVIKPIGIAGKKGYV